MDLRVVDVSSIEQIFFANILFRFDGSGDGLIMKAETLVLNFYEHSRSSQKALKKGIRDSVFLLGETPQMTIT